MSNLDKKEIYLDYAATAPIHDFVLDHLVNQYKSKLGNSTSIHQSGVKSSTTLEKARFKIAQKLNCDSDEVYFTSGATESNNLVLKSIFQMHKNTDRNEFLISSTEHSSITKCALDLRSQGLKYKEIPVDNTGVIDFSALEQLINEKTILISVAHANSEIGVIQNLKKIGEICKNKGVLFHSDGAQAFCKTPTQMREFNLDFYSVSGHKIQAPKGIGALYIKNKNSLVPQIIGGGQESSIRSGTVAVELASAFAVATELYSERSLFELKQLQEILLQKLKNEFSHLRIHGNLESRLINQLNFGLPGANGKKIMQHLNRNNIFVSLGSACNSGKNEASRVLTAIGLSEDQAFEAIRVSWGLQTTSHDILVFVSKLSEIVSDYK